MNRRALPVLLFFLLLLFYGLTLQPSLAWGDGIRLQREVITAESFILAEMVNVSFAPDPYPFARLGVAAWDHPLYVIIGHALLQLWPGDSLWLVNFLSALFGAGAVAILYQWGFDHTRSRVAAAFIALALAVSHTFWWHAVTPEVYTLFIFLLLFTIHFYDRYQRERDFRLLLLAAFGLGLGAANHLLALLALPAALLYHLSHYFAGDRRAEVGNLPRIPAGRWLLAGGAFLLGFAPYLVQLLRMLRTFHLSEVMGPAVGATFLRGSLALTLPALAQSALSYLTFLIYQFGPVGIALGVLGWWAGRRDHPTLWHQATTLYLVYTLFGLVYAVSDQFAFFLAAHVFWAVAAGMGALRILHWAGRRGARRLATAGLALSILAMPLLYSATPSLLRAAEITEEQFGIPRIGTGVRDGLDYYLNPNRRGDTVAYRFGRETLAALPTDALIAAEWYTDTDEYFIFRYFATVEGVRPDVEILGWPTVDPFAFDPALVVETVGEALEERPVYLASLNEEFYAVSTLAERYCIVAEHNLYRIYPSAGADRSCLHPGARP